MPCWRLASISVFQTSSCILFNPEGELDSFGFDAEDKYAELTLDDNHEDWFYFKYFKMLLYENEVRQEVLAIG